MQIRGEKGYILVAVMVIGMLVAIIGFAASKMSDLGAATYGSQKKYEIAGAAAEYAVNQAINSISLTGTCPGLTSAQINDSNGANYQYRAFPTGGYCFIRGQGSYRNATVVKTVVVPDTGDFDYGALTVRNGGSAATSGSSAIVSCDTACKSPAIVYGGTLTFTANLDRSDCRKGIYGVGADGIQSGAGVECTTSPCVSATLTDRVPKVFNVPSWSALQDKLDGTYNGYAVDVATLTVSNMPPTVPSGCQCAGALVLAVDKKGNPANTCNGTAWSVGTCSAVQGTSVTVSTMPAGVTTLYSTGTVTVSGNVSNAAIVGGAGVTLSSGTVTNSMITTTGTSASVTLGDASTNNSTIVTGGQFIMNKNSGTVSNTDIYAGTVKVIKQGGTADGGLIYSQGDFVFESTTSGNNPIGSSGNPVLMLAGGNVDLTKNNGTAEINGLVFAQGAFITDGSVTGNYTINGAVVANSESATSTFNSSGNGTLSFNHTILDTLSTRASLGGLVKQTACGGTFGRKAFISNSKVTVF